MSVTLNLKAYSSKENKQFQKHYNAVKFCIENELSFPIETSAFFKGKLGGEDLESIKKDCILQYIENGVEVPLKTTGDVWGNGISIRVSELPADVDLIIVKLS